MYNVEGKKFVIQWHLTHKCNLRCTHCYQEDYKTDLSKSNALNIFNQILNFFRQNKCKGHINFTGGEPLLCDYLFDILDLCESHKITFGLLTNGTLLNKDIVERLSIYTYLSFVQVSIDGLEKVHDTIRGKGSFNKTLLGLNLLRDKNIETMVAFTVHKNNYKDVDKVINLCRKEGVSRFWVDRIVPFGNLDIVLNNSEFEYVVNVLVKQSKKKGMLVHMNRAMQFLYGSDTIYNCSAGKTLLSILADGTLLPCRRLPIKVGNLLEKNINSYWVSSPMLKELQDNEIPDECKSCLVSDKCKGGAKCLTYAVNKTYNKKDVNCYIYNT